MKRIMQKPAALFPFSFKDLIATLTILGGALVTCLMLRTFEHTDAFAPMMFILAVFLTARLTSGYLFGVLASIIGVLAVNYVFTYPYFRFNFSLTGYPLTVVCMLAVSFVTSALTTQYKRQEELRLEMEREKTRANLLRAVSHDLRTPLTVIIGANSAVLENGDSLPREERDKMLREINEEAQWLIRIVENLLTVTRMDAGGAELHKQGEIAEELISASVSKFKRRFPNENVSVLVPEEMLLVPMDAILIEQVMINLLENVAMHATGASETSVAVRRERDFAVFEVKDNGMGIPPHKLRTLFSGEYRDDTDHKSGEQRGMGIGLSVCNSIVKAHGGEMSAENIPAGGALVRFTLPLEED